VQAVGDRCKGEPVSGDRLTCMIRDAFLSMTSSRDKMIQRYGIFSLTQAMMRGLSDAKP
jgi:hypothetical protein